MKSCFGMKIFNERITPTLLLSSFQEANVCSINLVPSIPVSCKLEYSQTSQLCLKTPGADSGLPNKRSEREGRSGNRGEGRQPLADPGGHRSRLPWILRFGGACVQFKSSTMEFQGPNFTIFFKNFPVFLRSA